MFILTTSDDLVEIKPDQFSRPSDEIIENYLNAKYCNKVSPQLTFSDCKYPNSDKVIQKIGLCICVFDILEASDGRIGYGTGTVNVNGELRMRLYQRSRTLIREQSCFALLCSGHFRGR